MRKIITTAATVSLSGALVLGATPAQAAAKPKPAAKPTAKASPKADRRLPQNKVRQLPPAAQKMVRQAEQMGTIGWDEVGPYFVWGSLGCRVHIFVAADWDRIINRSYECWF
ncbi:hypothetical protein ACQEU3_31865 [Spirillospora sp. CA-253888]